MWGVRLSTPLTSPTTPLGCPWSVCILILIELKNLGGNAVTSFFMSECMLNYQPHKNQVIIMLTIHQNENRFKDSLTLRTPLITKYINAFDTEPICFSFTA